MMSDDRSEDRGEDAVSEERSSSMTALGSGDGRAGTAFDDLVREQLRLLGEDPEREGLRRTPERVRDSLQWLTRGYDMEVEDAIGGAVFEDGHDSMVVVKDIELYSLCEHHLLPFFGKAHVGYIPSGQIVGLSKLARVIDGFARRLQVQERMTLQIRDAIEEVLEPEGVAVVVEAQHLCMIMRGVEKQHSVTTTSAMSGAFERESTRQEFMQLIRGAS